MAKKRAKTRVVRRKNVLDAGLLVSDRVELKDVRLVSSGCELTPEAMLGKKTFNIDYSTHVQADKKNGYVIVIPKFHFEAFTGSKAQKPVIVIDASFVLSYKIDNFEGLTQKAFEQFGNLNGIYNAWPYWREFVQNIIVRMGLPSLSIPVFRIVEAPKKRSVNQKVAKKKSKTKVASRK
jgi:hypothetical protein